MPSRAQERRRPQPCRAPSLRAFTLLEAVVVLVIVGVLLGVATVSYTGVRRGQLDDAGFAVLGVAQLDARRVASTQALTYPEEATLLPAMANASATADGRSVTYQLAPSTSGSEVAVARRDPTTVGFAVMTSYTGSWADGSADDGHCLLAVDSVTDGLVYAWMADAAAGSLSRCTPRVVVDCPTELATLPGAGTADDPRRVPSGFTCATAPASVTVDPVPCVVADALTPVTGVATRSARISWVPGADAAESTGYLLEAAGTTSAEVRVNAGERSHRLDGLAAGAVYRFRVFTLNSAGDRFGPTESNLLLLPPANPEVTVARATDAVTLTWVQAAGAASYEVTRTPAFSGAATQTVEGSAAVAGQLSFTDPTAVPAVDYTYAVSAVSAPQPVMSQCAVSYTGGGRATVTVDVPAP